MFTPLATKRTSSRALVAVDIPANFMFFLITSLGEILLKLAMLLRSCKFGPRSYPVIFRGINFGCPSHASLVDTFIWWKKNDHTSSAYFEARPHDLKWSDPYPLLEKLWRGFSNRFWTSFCLGSLGQAHVSIDERNVEGLFVMVFAYINSRLIKWNVTTTLINTQFLERNSVHTIGLF